MSVAVQGLQIDFVTVNSSSWTAIPTTVDCNHASILNVDAANIQAATEAAPTDFLVVLPNGQVPSGPASFPTRRTSRYLKGDVFMYVKSVAATAKVARLQTG